jgi:hypothetical protein
MADGKPISFLEASNLKNSSRKAELVTDNSYIPAVTIEGPEYDLYKTASGKYGEFNPLEISPAALLDKNQSRLNTWANGIAQFTSKAGTSFINAVGGLEVSSMNWLAQGVARGGDFNASDFTMDPLTQGLHSFDKAITDMFPVYQDPAEAEQPWYNQIGTADFWAGNVLPNFGFTVGTALGAYATGGIGLAGTALKGTKTASAIANAGKTTSRAIGRAFKTGEQGVRELRALGAGEDLARGINTISQQAYTGKGLIAKQVLGSGIAAVGEAKFEAIGTYEETYRDLIDKGIDEATADEYAKKAANVDFMLNLPVLTMSNFVQFGKLFSTGKTLKNPIANFIKGNYSTGFTTKNLQSFVSRKLVSAPKWLQKTADVAGTLGKVAKNSAWEGFEEWAQYQGNKVAKNYSERIRTGWNSGMGAQMDGLMGIMQDTQTGVSNILGATGEELGAVGADIASLDPERIFGGQGGENFMLGVLIGALGLPVNTKGDFAGGIVGAFQDSKKEEQRISQRNAFATEVVNNLNAMREKYGKNKTLRDALVSQSFSADATEALEKGDFSTFKAMEALGLAHDILTAAEAGQGDLFTDMLNSTDPIIASEVRDHVRQNLKEGQVDPLANLTDEEIENKVNENKENLKKNIALIKKINSYVSPLNGITPELSKQITGKLFLAKDIDNRMEDVIRGLNKTMELIAPKDPEEAAKFNEQVNEFFNPNNIKETLANVASNKDVAEFEANVLNKVTELMKKGVLDQNEASEMATALFDLSRNSKLRKNILEQYSKIASEPEKYNEWVEEKIAETSIDEELTLKVGQSITELYKNAGIPVPENILDVEEGRFYGKIGNETVTITKEKGKKPVIKVNESVVSAATFLAMSKLNEFTPLSEEQFIEAQEAVNAAKRQRKEERITEEVLQEAIAGVEQALEENNKLYEELLKSKEPLLNRIASYQKDIAELKNQITALAKTKNKFTRKDLPALEELLKETEALIDEVTKEIDVIDSQIDAVISKEEELESKKQFFEELLNQNFVSADIKAKMLEIRDLTENKEAINLIETLRKEKEALISMREELTELFNDLTEEENLIKVFDTLDAIDKRLAEIPALIEELRKNRYSIEGRRKFEYLGQLRINIKNRLKQEAKEVDDKNINKTNQPVEEQGIKLQYADSAKKPINIGFFTTTGNETIDGTDTPTQNEREQRWYGYINNKSKKDLKKGRLLIFSKNSPYNDPEKLGEELHITDGETDLFVLVVDAKGDPIEDNGKYIWTSLHLPEPKGAKDRFSYPKDLDESEEEVLYRTAQKDYITFRNKVMAKEKAGKKPLVKIIDRSRGKSKKEVTEGNNLLAATNHTIKWLPLEVVINGVATLPQSTMKNEPNGSIWTETTLGDPFYVTQNMLSQEDAEVAFEIIKEILLNKNNKIEGRNIREILQKMIFVGKSSQDKYQIYFAKDSLFIQGTRIDKVDLEEQKDKIITFLKTKLYNVDKGTLDKANEELKKGSNLTKFYKPVFKNGKITFEEFTTYKHFLVEQALKVYAPNFGESPTLNKYLQFNNELEGKPAAPKKGETVILEGGEIGELVDLGGNEEEDKIAGLRAKEEEEVKKIIPNIDDYKVDGVINKDKVLEGIEDRRNSELDEVSAVINQTDKKFLEDKINAKYDAEKDAYNEIYDRYDKLITGAAKGTTTETKSWKKIRDEFNYQRGTFGLDEKTNNKSRQENTFVKALENIIENSSSAKEIELAKFALGQLNPSKKEQVSENIPTLDADAALADFADAYGLETNPGNEKQNEEGEEVEENCTGKGKKK